ncbi:MAG: hypothetical protein HOK61_04190 [Alphaproteobacteria bacterium]|jgi:alkylation response protein AidB-like acyl-CoA dehydrogenase|nr:hypothetical protein [Alphaproteobacteria bacterium]
MPAPEPPLLHADMLTTAEALIPVLRDRADEADKNRRLSDDTLADLRAAGFARLLQPAAFGGYEMGFPALVDVLSTIGRGCSATGWVLGQYCIHAYMTGFFPPEGQHEVWDDDPETFLVGVLAFPAGRATRVDGGFRLSGRWSFASGIDGAKWCIFGANLLEDGQPPKPWLFHVSLSEATQDDNWYTSGLRATGSKDVIVDDVFVPTCRTLDVERTKNADSPGLALNNAPIFRTPMFGCFGFVQGSATLGGAMAASEIFTGQMRERVATSSGARIAGFMTLHSKVAEAEAAINAAAAILKTDAARIMAIAEAGEIFDMETRLALRRNAAYAAKLSVGAVDDIVSAAGGAALFDTNPLSRTFRDAHACLAHITMNWEANAVPAGRQSLGLDSEATLL